VVAVGAAAVVAAGAAAVGAAAVVAVGAAVAAPPQAITANIANKAVSKHNRLINWLSEITIQESSKKIMRYPASERRPSDGLKLGGAYI